MSVEQATGREERARSAAFRFSYWDRCTEMADLLGEPDHARLLDAAKKARVGRKMRATLRQSKPATRMPLTLDEVDEVAKRYALWTVRKSFDWDQPDFARGASPMALQLHVGLVTGIWALDVDLRRQIEQFFRQGHPEPTTRVSQLRFEVESRAGAMAADIDLCHTVDASPMRFDWNLICENYDVICNDLDQLLARAAGVPEGWQPDPTGRHEVRYWDGSEWTAHVSTGDSQSIDPI